jgi:hypothetical protein
MDSSYNIIAIEPPKPAIRPEVAGHVGAVGNFSGIGGTHVGVRHPVRRRRRLAAALVISAVSMHAAADSGPRLRLEREANHLIITGQGVPGPITINYMEAYCRDGSTERDWVAHTKIKHASTVLSVSPEVVRLRETLADGVVFEHTITAGTGEVDFRVVARNPTEQPSAVHWAQPCVRVDRFTGTGRADLRALVPAYVRQSFLFIDGRLTMMPTMPWAEKALYTPGQVYVPAHVSRGDVNPRPLSVHVPSNGLVGCYSADRTLILATAWEPFQEVFQGVISCLHSDFRVGGLAPGETRHIRGKLYIMPADPDALLRRFERDFPEQARRK